MAIHISRGEEWFALQKALNLPEDLRCKEYNFSQRSGNVTEVTLVFHLTREQVHAVNKALSEVTYKPDVLPID